MKLAEYQDLYYVKKVDFGVYLAEDMGGETHVLLPSKQVPEDAKPGEKIRVFLYKDSKDRLIATTNTPKLTLGEYAPLVVKEVGKIGAFLDWGLEKRSVPSYGFTTVIRLPPMKASTSKICAMSAESFWPAGMM